MLFNCSRKLNSLILISPSRLRAGRDYVTPSGRASREPV